MGPHVGKVVDPNSEATGHLSKGVAHRVLVSAKGPGAACPVTREDNMHRAPDADGALEFATMAPDSATVLRSDELGVHIAGQERPLHESPCSELKFMGQCCLVLERLSIPPRRQGREDKNSKILGVLGGLAVHSLHCRRV